MSTLCMSRMRPLTSPYKALNHDICSQRKKTGTKSVAIATSKYVPCGVLLRVNKLQ